MLIAAALIVIWFANLDYHKLIRPDEGRYAEIAREMAVTGDWITPRLNGIKYFEKPPLQYWATASAFKVFGEHHWTARLWPGATGFLGVIFVFLAGRRLFGAAAGYYAALVLASSALYVGIAHMNSLDIGLTFFMAATALAFLLAQREDIDPAASRRWMLGAWACAGLAVLSKGLIGIVLPAGVIAIYVLLQRDWGLLGRLQWAWGTLTFLAITAPWFVLVQHANPEFARFFFIHEHFGRFLNLERHHVRPWWFFVPVLTAGSLPWITLLPQALIRGWRATHPAREFQPERFLFIWATFIFVFFSMSGSKLLSYILPILPALALLTGSVLAKTATPRLRGHAVSIAIVGGAVVVLSPGAIFIASEQMPTALLREFVPWIAASGTALLMGGGCAILFCRLGQRSPALLSIAFGGLIATQTFITGHDALSPSYSAYYMAQEIRPHLAKDARLFSVRTYDQTLPYYLKRTIELVAFQGEFAYGLSQEPWLSLPDIPSFEQAWRSEPSPLAIMETQTYTQLAKNGLPMQIIARGPGQIAVRRPDATW